MIDEFLFNKLKEEYSNVTEIISGFIDRYTTIRVNNIKSNIVEIKHILNEHKINYKEVSWYSDALIIENAKEEAIRKLDIYRDGKIYMQSLSSMLPVLLLNIKDNESILDMAASPGGKTSQIASISNNNARITACEVNKARMERLKYNLKNQGVTSCYTMLIDSRYIDSAFTFDKILLDAPCSGSGTLNINKKNNGVFNADLLRNITKRQELLLDKAISILRKNGILVYSTCSILKDENEKVIKKFIDSGRVEVVPIDLEEFEDIPVLRSEIEGVMTVCPNELYEGFFMAKLRKVK